MSSFVSIPDANDENPLDASKQGLVESKESKETFDGFNVDNIYLCLENHNSLKRQN